LARKTRRTIDESRNGSATDIPSNLFSIAANRSGLEMPVRPAGCPAPRAEGVVREIGKARLFGEHLRSMQGEGRSASVGPRRSDRVIEPSWGIDSSVVPRLSYCSWPSAGDPGRNDEPVFGLLNANHEAAPWRLAWRRRTPVRRRSPFRASRRAGRWSGKRRPQRCRRACIRRGNRNGRHAAAS
jgi:hypothetical protein